MKDLISRQAVIDLLKQMRKDGNMVPWEGKDVFARIRKLPSAQPKRKRGKWIPHEDEDGEHYGDKCSECGEWYVMPYGKTNYCPTCGADMRGEQDG